MRWGCSGTVQKRTGSKRTKSRNNQGGGGLTENIIVRQARSPVIDELLEELRLNVVESVDCALRCAFRLVDVGGCGVGSLTLLSTK